MQICFEILNDRGYTERYLEFNDILFFSCVEKDKRLVYNLVPKFGSSFSLDDSNLSIYYIVEDD